MFCAALQVLAIVGALGASAPSSADAAAANELRAVLRSAGFDVGAKGQDDDSASLLRVTRARQDYALPTKDLCCHTGAPLHIGQQTFKKGLGAHANGEVVLELLKPSKRFVAYVGIDNNPDTQGAKGSVRFIVRANGAERFRSPICRGGEEPVKVEVDLAGASSLELVAEDAGDGHSYDQADWAEASLEAADGTREYIGDAFTGRCLDAVPTSFTYNGESCWNLLKTWQKKQAAPDTTDGSVRYATTWTEPGSGFRATLTVTVYEGPAAEFQWHFENTGNAPSGLIEAIRSIDLRMASAQGQTVLHSCSGGLAGNFQQSGERVGFELAQTALGHKTLTVDGGRSSNGDSPFFALTRPGTWGFVAALGWSGQWKAEGQFDKDRSEAVFHAGMEPVHFRLPAGESVLLPTGLILPFQGDLSEGTNRLRRLLHTRYQAKLGGEPVLPPVSFNSWFVFDNRVNDAMVRELATEAAQLGIEYFCQDAGWFEGDFPNGVGNWTIAKNKFPNGLKPVAEHIHALGMKFGLWFEPERVADGTQWQREYPELLLKRNLLDMGNPRAREIILNLLDTTVSENGVDWIRYDFNIDPLEAWASVEGDEEKGLRQIRYINGLYEVTAELMRRHPKLLIEQCASGGRRLDLQTIRLGHTFWKSDETFDQPLMRFHETGANVFLPGGLLNTNYDRYRNEGEMLALFGGPLGFGIDFRTLTAEQKASIKKTVAAYKQVRRFINEDYYPLFAQGKTGQTWCGWQFLDRATQEGVLVEYRPENSPYDAATIALSRLESGKAYEFTDIISEQKLTKTAEELSAGFSLPLEKGGAKVIAFHCVR